MATRRFIPVAAPTMVGREREYVLDCVDATWVSSIGSYIEAFERGFAGYCGATHGLACCNGTAALHLALLAAGISAGDEVIVPAMTFVATANAVRYCGAEPVFVDSESDTWNLDPEAVERAVTPRTRAIVAVHLFGNPAEMDALDAIARRHRLTLIEDAAEAHGAEYRGRRAGALAILATFSFYGNKIITTGEGGMVLTSDDDLARRVFQLKGQGVDPTRRYWFPVVGYNYRMTNIAAAIGLAQLERIDWQLERRAEVASWYRERLGGVPGITFQAVRPWVRHVHWMVTILLGDEIAVERDAVMEQLHEAGIETRPAFHPLHSLPPYADPARPSLPVAERVGRRALSLPTWAGLTRDDVDRVCGELEKLTGIPRR
ncbi:MAG: DegT/DnrJ/EryC1/StrS family aminotransferase [Acidobacteria bacterium]|nr:DegT/DnrJ/EryC1/StrS family aminotransferase [Acidobacteriota bacterium]